MGLYATLTILFGLTIWKPRLSLYLFILASPLVSVYQGLGWDPRVGWAFLIGVRATLPNETTGPLNLRIVTAAITFFVVAAIILRLHMGSISPDDASSAWTFFIYFLAGAAFIFAASRFIDGEQEVAKALAFLGVATAAVAVYALWQGYSLYANDHYDRVGSTLINPNGLAAYMGVCAITLLAGRRLVNMRSWRFFIFLVVAAASIGLFLSLSRGGLMAYMVGLLLHWATAGGKLAVKRTLVIAVVSCFAVFIAYYAVRSYRIQKATEQMNQRQADLTEISQSMEDLTRYEAATFALEQWKEHPLFGIGFQTFPAVNYDKNGFYVTTHDTFLQLLVGTGLVGTLLICYILKELWGSLQKSSKILILPAAGCAAVNSLFGDLLGVIEIMVCVSLAYFLCRHYRMKPPLEV